MKLFLDHLCSFFLNCSLEIILDSNWDLVEDGIFLFYFVVWEEPHDMVSLLEKDI